MRLLVALALCLPLLAQAHGDAHERLKSLDAQIRSQPDNADLRLRRGRLYMEEAHYKEARTDLEKVLALAPHQLGARYFLAEALFYGEQHAQAEQQAQLFIGAHGPQELGARSRGYWLIGQTRMARHQPTAAIEAYRQALQATGEPTPDQYQLFVEACRAARGPYLDEALRVLDQGLSKGGSVDLLQGMALEIELQAGRPDAALTRLERIIALKQRLPFLQTRKAEILLDAGRTTEARQAVAAARDALATVQTRKRRATAYLALDQQLAALEARLNTTASTTASMTSTTSGSTPDQGPRP